MHLTVHAGLVASLHRLRDSRGPDLYGPLLELMGNGGAGRLDLVNVADARDPRVRTTRLDDAHDAVVFILKEGADATMVIAVTAPRADAHAWARTACLTIDPASGALELIGPELPPAVIAADAADHLPRSGRGRQQDTTIDLRGVAGSRVHGGKLDTAGPPAVPAGSDDDVRAALARESSRPGFVAVTDDIDLRRILDGDFAAWKVFLHPTQRALVYRRSYGGSFRVTGGPGTGKTVVALHRTFQLARRHPAARILLCTYNRTLADITRHQLTELAGPVAARVDVLGVDQVVQRVLRRTDQPSPRLLPDQEDLALWRLAVVDAGPFEHLPVEGLARLLRDEYRYVILPLGLAASQDAYLSCVRHGRGTPLGRRQREHVWRAVQAYRRRLGRCSTFAQQAAVAAHLAAADTSVDLRYHHAIVDEGQDLQPVHWLLLRRLVPPGPDDFFVCEDRDQRLYGPQVALSRYGISTRGRSRRLDVNYRSTHQILGTAVRVLGEAPTSVLEGEPAGVDHGRSRLSGPAPRLLSHPTQKHENDAIAWQLRAWIDADRPGAGEFAVLVRRNRDAEDLAGHLRRAGVPARTIGTEDTGGSEPVHVLTMHRAKGGEYAKVVVARVTDAILPDPRALADTASGEVADVTARERSLLYIACTRARDELVITYAGTPSRFLLAVLSTAPGNGGRRD